MRRCAILLYVTVSLIIFNSPSAALAGSANDLPSVSVSAVDLDLTSRHDQKVLDKRIRFAAWHLCDRGTISTRLMPDKCMADAIRVAQHKRDELVDRRIAAKANVSQPAHAAQDPAASCAPDGEQKPGDYDACGNAVDSTSNRHTSNTREDEDPTDEATTNALKGW